MGENKPASDSIEIREPTLVVLPKAKIQLVALAYTRASH